MIACGEVCFTCEKRSVRVIIALVAAAGGALVATWATPLAGQAPAAYRAPRTADGKPDLNGIWQALNAANYDIETHMARPAMALAARARTVRCRRRRCSRSAPSARCRRVWASSKAATIPYKPEALAKKKENQENWLERDPEIKCYLPGVPRANYMPYPFQILQSHERDLLRLRVRRRRAEHLPEGSRPGAGRLVDGPVGRPLGRRHARHRRHRLQRLRPGSIAPATSTARSCTSSSATRAPRPT